MLCHFLVADNGGSGFEILATKSDKGEGGSKLADFLVKSFLNDP